MASKDKKASKGSTSRAGGIRTLSDLNRHSADSDSDSDGPQEYYTGGEKSGMLVQDPSKDNNDNSVDAILDKVRQLGAVEGPILPPSGSRSFTGTARLLSGETTQSASQQPETVVHNIVFWTDGFTVNDGPLRRFDDPENVSFLESIKKSEYPKELEPADKGTGVFVNLTKRNENYRPEPEKHQIAFQGQGRTLGSSSAPTAPAAASASHHQSTAPNTSESVVVDETLPTTSIQLRLADGTRLIGRFNHHHTIGNIRSFINASRPECPRNYVLQMMGFPPMVLGDPTQTIEQAGLANSVVIQKF